MHGVCPRPLTGRELLTLGLPWGYAALAFAPIVDRGSGATGNDRLSGQRVSHVAMECHTAVCAKRIRAGCETMTRIAPQTNAGWKRPFRIRS